MSALVPLLLATVVAVFLSRIVALSKYRNPIGWMWAAALFPPSLLALMLLPARRPAFAEV